MKLMLELTDSQVVQLSLSLRVSTEHYKMVNSGAGDLAPTYALRILMARKALGLPMSFVNACDDYVQKDDCGVCDSGLD